jgi:hypothetical protein
VGWFLKWAGWQAYAVFAAALAALGLTWWGQTVYLRGKINDAVAAKQVAEKQLSDRIAAEATAIADAVTKARAEEQSKLKDQEVKYAKLQDAVRAGRAALAGSEQRLFQLAQAAGGACAGRAADSATVASRIADASPDELRPADRVLIGDLLQIAGDAKQVAEERNWLVDQYITNCERK